MAGHLEPVLRVHVPRPQALHELAKVLGIRIKSFFLLTSYYLSLLTVQGFRRAR
jgi:hypothetical protein